MNKKAYKDMDKFFKTLRLFILNDGLNVQL